MPLISSGILERLEAVSDLITMARDLCPQAFPRPDEVLSDAVIANLFLAVVSDCGLEQLPIDEYFWAEPLWELQSLLKEKAMSAEKRISGAVQWILRTSEIYALDLCGFDYYYNAILYDDVEFLFEEHAAYPLMALALSTGAGMLADDQLGYSLEHVQPAHVLGAALMALSQGYRIPEAEFAARFGELPMLAFQLLYFHLLPEENPFCGELENENRMHRYYFWPQVPDLVAASAQYADILEASPNLGDLMEPPYLFRHLLAIQELG